MAQVLFAAPVALVTALVLRERRSERPLLDLTLPASRGFLLNTLAATLGMNMVLLVVGAASLVTALLAAALLPRTAPSAGVAPAPGDARE
ncbi:hypothetical protein ACFVY1_24630 [Streptomyces sp. NPDC058293]|uniref:hypothetical protein n=1 Tax=unclassified Streptomyces TaxID=2593676 RepID=UPI0033BA9EF1